MITIHDRARQMAYSLGIAVYITDDGRISQHPPGERVDPGNGAMPEAAARGDSTLGKES